MKQCNNDTTVHTFTKP
jgi:hypothetical protein